MLVSRGNISHVHDEPICGVEDVQRCLGLLRGLSPPQGKGQGGRCIQWHVITTIKRADKAFGAEDILELSQIRTVHPPFPAEKKEKEEKKEAQANPNPAHQSELCAELDISHSGLSEVEYPHAFPSPPREISTSQAFQSSASFFEQPRSAHAPEDRASESQLEDQKTWFYYLAEIALRKVEIRMSDTFQQRISRSSNHDGTSSSNSSGGEDSVVSPTMDDLLHMANEFELQLELWLSCLPLVLKFPNDPALPCSDERLQYLRQRYWWNLSRVYRPFIYYLIHHPPTHSAHQQMLVYARKGLEIDIFFIRSNVITHRHHGAWLCLRALTSNSVIILAARKARVIDPMPLGWRDAIRLAKNCLLFWESEVRDAGKLRDVVMRVEKGVE